MIRSFFLFFYFFIFFISVKSQINLIPNGSFEKFKNKSNLITNALPWKNINTVDYYRAPLKNDTSIYKGAKSGVAYGGIRLQKDYNEILYVKLIQPLKIGKSYHFEVNIRLAYWSNLMMRSFGAHFSKAGYRVGEKVDSTNSILFFDKKGFQGERWITLQGYYVAKGGEKIISIGNFAPRLKKDLIKINPLKFELMKGESYYFIDDISLVEGKDTSQRIIGESTVTLLDTVFKKGKTFNEQEIVKLNTVFFEEGKADIQIESLNQLDNFVKYLEDHPDSDIQVNAFVISNKKNRKSKKLSTKRAAAVCDYLSSKDVLNKLFYQGYIVYSKSKSDTQNKEKEEQDWVEFKIVSIDNNGER